MKRQGVHAAKLLIKYGLLNIIKNKYIIKKYKQAISL